MEIGVQSVFEDVARDTNRGHTVRAVCESFQLGKDNGYKIVSHHRMESIICCVIHVLHLHDRFLI